MMQAMLDFDARPPRRTRDTSIEAYHAVRNSGHVGERQRQVYEILYRFGPLTANETWNRLADEIGGLRFDSNTRARFTELRDMGVIAEVGKVRDPVTGKRVIHWDVTARPPSPRTKGETKDQTIARLTRRVAELEARLAAA